jgi:hypothetical protein
MTTSTTPHRCDDTITLLEDIRTDLRRLHFQTECATAIVLEYKVDNHPTLLSKVIEPFARNVILYVTIHQRTICSLIYV